VSAIRRQEREREKNRERRRCCRRFFFTEHISFLFPKNDPTTNRIHLCATSPGSQGVRCVHESANWMKRMKGDTKREGEERGDDFRKVKRKNDNRPCDLDLFLPSHPDSKSETK